MKRKLEAYVDADRIVYEARFCNQAIKRARELDAKYSRPAMLVYLTDTGYDFEPLNEPADEAAHLMIIAFLKALRGAANR